MNKIYLHDGTESAVNSYLTCRDGLVYKKEYYSDGGYGNRTVLFTCFNTKHESVSIIRQTYIRGEIHEDVMDFYSDDYEFLVELVKGQGEVVRDYSSTDTKLNYRL